MAIMGRLWAGRVYGTNTGNLFVDLETTDDELRGTLRFMDSAFGLVIYEIKGCASHLFHPPQKLWNFRPPPDIFAGMDKSPSGKFMRDNNTG